MSFFQEDGVLTSRTSTGTDVVTLTGTGAALDVKLVRLVLNGATATGGANADFVISVGFSDGTTEHEILGYSQDNVTTTVSKRATYTTGLVAVSDSSGALIDLGTISSIGTGTFTINWTVKSGAAYKIGWTAWGGTDITAVELGDFLSPTSPAGQDITTTIKSADMGFFYGISGSSASSIGTQRIFGFGMADSSLNQGLVGGSSQNAIGTSNTDRYQITNECVGSVFAGSVREAASLTAFDATHGIQLSWSTAAVAQRYYYVLIKGGRWEVGSGTTSTSAATKAYTTTFPPVGVTTLCSNDTASATINDHGYMSIGSTDGSSSYSFSVADTHGKTTTETGISHSTSNVVQTFITSDVTAGGGIATLTGEGTFDSFNALDFTLDFTGNADSALREFIWLACAENGSAGSPYYAYAQQ